MFAKREIQTSMVGVRKDTLNRRIQQCWGSPRFLPLLRLRVMVIGLVHGACDADLRGLHHNLGKLITSLG